MKKYFIFLPLFTACEFKLSEKAAVDYSAERARMVESQIVRRGLKDQRVISAMLSVPRHKFIPNEIARFAYEDRPLPIGYKQTISQPYIVAAMTEALKLKPYDNVLEIGTGSGYQAAVLAQLVSNVYSIEIVPELAARAKKTLKELACTNVQLKCADGYLGWAEAAPFDAIIVTCAPDDIPKPLTDQLAEGGRIIIPVGGDYGQELVKITKKNGELVSERLMSVIFVPMTGKAMEK